MREPTHFYVFTSLLAEPGRPPVSDCDYNESLAEARQTRAWCERAGWLVGPIVKVPIPAVPKKKRGRK